MKIVLVDDERIAIEHIKSLLEWEQLGFTIAATATNGKSALRLCEDIRPQIMIVDIRMPVMDGLELIQAVCEKRLGVKFIMMSAYEDFDYARKAISLGHVSSYLIKHEVDSHKLLLEVNKAKDAWEAEEAQRHMLRSEQLKDMVTGTGRYDLMNSIAKPPYSMVLFHADTPFSAIPSGTSRPEAAFSLRWTWEEEQLFANNGAWQLAGGFPLGASQIVVLFSLKNKPAAPMRETIRELLLSIRLHLSRKSSRTFSIYYSCETDEKATLPSSYHKVKAAALHAVFCGPETMACADDLPLPGDFDTLSAPPVRFHEVVEGVEQNNADIIENAIIKLFAQICHPVWNLRGLFHAIRGLTTFINEHRVQRGMLEIDPFDIESYEPLYGIDEIRDRFSCLLRELCTDANDSKRVSNKLQKALRYIHEHYYEDINIDAVSYATEISASYLHQLFKRELARTFLDYLTEHRVNQAKRILRHGDAKMTEVATSVGYRSPQHFSQVFKKITGILPHHYRSGDYKL